MALESVEGQALELGWRRDNNTSVNVEDYLRMVFKKTCWLATIYPIRVGVLIATRDQTELDPLIRFGFFLGAAFQIQDDLLNLVADERYGKELNGDILEGKRTIMLLHLLQQAQASQRKQIHDFLSTPRLQRTNAQVDWIRQLMDQYGSIDYARQIGHGLAGAALHEYSLIFDDLPDSRDKRFIEGLVTWVFERT